MESSSSDGIKPRPSNRSSGEFNSLVLARVTTSSFRSHAHIDTRRREPWLFSKQEMEKIREALKTRYTYLPLWYTLFYEGEKNGVPPMRPVW